MNSVEVNCRIFGRRLLLYENYESFKLENLLADTRFLPLRLELAVDKLLDINLVDGNMNIEIDFSKKKKFFPIPQNTIK